MKLTLSKSTIRSFRATDAQSITEHIGSYSIARNTSLIPHPYTLKNAEDFLTLVSSQQPETQFAITLDDLAIGGIGLQFGNPKRTGVSRYNAKLGYWLGETFWGNGIMTEAVIALTDWAFDNLDLIRIQAAVYARNAASARVLIKAGFQLEGRLRACYFKEDELIDGMLYAKVRLRK
jgi:[ribosomal protein S5]-alanine N-acetyltransferase